MESSGRHADKIDRRRSGWRQMEAHADVTDLAILTLVATDSRIGAQSRSLIHCLAASQEPPTATTAGCLSQQNPPGSKLPGGLIFYQFGLIN